MLLAVLVACVDPVIFGAIPDDGKPDNIALQLAIEKAVGTHTDVCLGPGVWNLARTNQVASLMIHGGPLTIRGQGASSVLRMTGDGLRHDWRAIEVAGGHDVTLVDFAIDGLEAFDTEEQTHLIEVGPDSRSVTIARMTLGPMRRPEQPVGAGIGGDCIRLLGNLGHEVEDVTISDSQLVDCDRSGIALQRGLRRIAIRNTKITGTGDTPIDFEPTGRGAIEAVKMTGLDIERPPQGQGALSIAIGGTGEDLASGIVLSDSTVSGGGIDLVNVADVEIVDNVIDSGPRNRVPSVSIFRRARDVRIARNKITRPTGAAPAAVIRATPNNGSFPRGIVIEDNALVQETAASTISLVSTSSVVIRHNAFDVTKASAEPVISLEALHADVSEIKIFANAISGPASSLVFANPRSFSISKLAAHANEAHDFTKMIDCKTSNAIREVEVDAPDQLAGRCSAAKR